MLLIILQLSCSSKSELNEKLDFRSDIMQVNAILDGYKKSDHHLGFSTLVYARVIVENSSNDVLKFDLNNLKIQIDTLHSNSVFIDTIGDVIIREKEISPNEIIEYEVYWSFLNQAPNLKSGDIKLFYNYSKPSERMMEEN